MKIKDLFEVKVIPKGLYDGEPLKDTESIKLYHGTPDVNLCIVTLTHGFSGDKNVNRTYSYENNNNPYGLFVSPDFTTAKEFGDFIIEFHCEISDLEAPVWPNGSFTSQGQMSGVFKDENERKEAQLHARKEHQNSDNEVIANSDRPELAATLLFSGERQALFTGTMNPHGIQAIWIRHKGKSNFTRYRPKEFLSTLEYSGFSTNYGRVKGKERSGDIALDASDKLFKPKDKVTFLSLMGAYEQKMGYKFDPGMIDFFREQFRDNPDEILRLVWSKQQANDVLRTLDED